MKYERSQWGANITLTVNMSTRNVPCTLFNGEYYSGMKSPLPQSATRKLDEKLPSTHKAFKSYEQGKKGQSTHTWYDLG